MSAAFLEDEIAKNIFGPGDSVLAWGQARQEKQLFVTAGIKFQAHGVLRVVQDMLLG